MRSDTENQALLEEVLLPASNRTASLAETNVYTRAAVNVIKMCQGDIVTLLQEGDQGLVFAPVEFEVDGRSLDGGVLALQDRAILTWWKGTFKIRNFRDVMRYDAITETRLDDGKLHVIAEKSWTIGFPAFFGRFRMDRWLEGIFTGVITLSESGEFDS